MPPLERTPIHRLLGIFSQSIPLQPGDLDGFWLGRLAGPWWLRLGGAPTLWLCGFNGWLGKSFSGRQHAINVFQSGDAQETRFPMHQVVQPSRLDGQPCLALLYKPDARVPWRWVTDELRRTPQGTVLGITFVDAPVLRRFAFPFTLTRPRK